MQELKFNFVVFRDFDVSSIHNQTQYSNFLLISIISLLTLVFRNIVHFAGKEYEERPGN